MNNLIIELNELKRIVTSFISRPRNIAFSVFGLGASCFLYFTLKIYLQRRKYRNIPGPPTNGIIGFYLGNLPEVQKKFNEGKMFPELCSEWQHKYGHVFKVQFLNQMMIITTDRDTIRDALIIKNFPKLKTGVDQIANPFGQRFIGSGLVTEQDYDKWKHRRAIFNPGFHRHVLMTFVGQFNQISNNVTEKFRTLADGKTAVQLFNEINRATLDAIALIAFGMNTDAVNQKESTLNIYLSKTLQTVMNSLLDPLMRFKPSKQKEIREIKKMIRYMRKIGKDQIMERINAFKSGENAPDDILSSILSSFKEDNLDLEAMTDDFITFFVAGQETTANALAFCFLEMGKNPEIAKKAREEIDRVLGERAEVTYQDVNDLKYCSAIFKETLRLYPPLHMIGRQTPEDIVIDGIVLPKNSELYISIFANGRYEGYFKDPLEFKPERFLKTSGLDTEMENYVYLPFSIGPRNCIGQTFAHLEGVIMIAKILQKFDFKLDPTQSMAIHQALTLRPKDGTRCFLTLRN